VSESTYGQFEVDNHEQPDLSALRAGRRVLVDGRAATVVYPHPGGEAVVVRFDGEYDNRVVAFRKLNAWPDTPEAA
jgi:hypothetical protein